MIDVKFCDQCGTRYHGRAWPKICPTCHTFRYRNPVPAAVVLQPIGSDGDLLVIMRGVEPQYGQLALPGGYIDYGETWQDGAARELYEETGIVRDAKDMQHFQTVSSAKGEVVIIFALAPVIAEMPKFVPNEEVLGMSVISMRDSRELAFIAHVDVVRKYWQWYALGENREIVARS